MRIVLLGVLALALEGSSVLSRLLDARVLLVLIILDVALLGWRLVAIAQAHGERSRLTCEQRAHHKGPLTGYVAYEDGMRTVSSTLRPSAP